TEGLAAWDSSAARSFITPDTVSALSAGPRKDESVSITWKTVSGCAKTRNRRMSNFWPIQPGGRGSSPCLKAGVSAAMKFDEETGLRVCLDRRHRLISGLDGVDGLQTASRSAGCRLTPPVDGRSDGRPRRPHPGHRPGRLDAADHGRPGAGRARGRRAGG